VRTLDTVRVTRYVTPRAKAARSRPSSRRTTKGLIRGEVSRGGPGTRALVAELVSGEIARVLGLPVPRIVFVDLDKDLARTEPDPEISAHDSPSAGSNLALDYLPGSVMFDPAVNHPAADLSSRIGVVRRVRHECRSHGAETNLLACTAVSGWIDHGATLYFHHNTRMGSRTRFVPAIRFR